MGRFGYSRRETAGGRMNGVRFFSIGEDEGQQKGEGKESA